jgi:hypothetical protein
LTGGAESPTSCCAAPSFLAACRSWVIFDLPNSSVRGQILVRCPSESRHACHEMGRFSCGPRAALRAAKKGAGGWPPARCNPFPWTPGHGRLLPLTAARRHD